jgi:oxygen-independent coproporphyrinogen-3 oxidase
MKNKEVMVDAIIEEIIMRKSYLNNASVKTIYFGGGTPSILTSQELYAILKSCYDNYNIADNAELTLEANPDDLTQIKTKELYDLGINRLSIGIQSFHDKDIQWMNRSHNSDQSFRSIEYAFNAGIDNFSVDLIFGSPTTSDEQWLNNLSLAHGFGIKHLSCYGLTVEEDTALHHFVRTKKVKPPNDLSMARQYQLTMEALSSYGYDHYEISNYALPGYVSKHNTNYWKSVPYLGIGPSAHSYNGSERSWNVANNVKYLTNRSNDMDRATVEKLSTTDVYNEYIMTGLRTSWGCDIDVIARIGAKYKSHFIQSSQYLVDNEDIIIVNKNYILNKQSWVISDNIISQLFYDESVDSV